MWARAQSSSPQSARAPFPRLGALGLAALFALALGAVSNAGCGWRTSTPEGGASISCVRQLDCPQSADPCVVSTCFEQRCLVVSAAANTVVKPQKAGDCHMRVCDGNGAVMEIDDDVDLPPDDGNACTEAACKGGAGVHEPVAVGETCGENGVCNGRGACGACLPGARQCDGNAVSTCDDEGQWAMAPCPGGRPLCKAAACIGLRQVATGAAHTCVIFEDSYTRCFGASGTRRGQGGGVVQVGSVIGAEQIALGSAHTCARLDDGAVFCWGDNTFGQIGDGTTENPRPPTPVLGLAGATAIAAGDEHTCAIASGGKVSCWGRGDHGRLGAPPGPAPRGPRPSGEAAPPSEETPAPGGRPATLVPGLFGASTLVLGGRHGCGLWPGGRIGCFGEDDRGQLGGGFVPAPTGKPKPGPKPSAKLVVVKGLEGAVSLSLGARHGCALLEDGTVHCWGDNGSGQLGDGTTSPRTGPVVVKDLSGVTAISLGSAHGCALLSDGSVRCWGANGRGQLGDGTTDAHPSPVAVAGLAGVRSLVSGGNRNCVMLADGAPRCWGANRAGEVGDGTTEDKPSPSAMTW